MSEPLRVAVLADTHLGADLARLPEAAWLEVAAADVVLHAGDVTTPELLERLAGVAPVHAVLGNNDVGLDHLPERLEVDLGGVSVAMVHDAGPRKGRERRLRRWFPGADLVVFGHSHVPEDGHGEDGQRLFNPGSAVQRRRQPHRTMGRLVLGDGRILEHRILRLD